MPDRIARAPRGAWHVGCVMRNRRTIYNNCPTTPTTESPGGSAGNHSNAVAMGLQYTLRYMLVKVCFVGGR